MRSILVALAIAAVAAMPLPAQSAADLLAIELAAAKRALSNGNVARNMIVVDSMFATRAAPGAPTATRRPSARTDALSEALTRPGAYRRPYGATLLLISEPLLRGDEAEVVTTTLQRAPSGRQEYRTLAITLRREGKEWVVVGAKVLGAS